MFRLNIRKPLEMKGAKSHAESSFRLTRGSVHTRFSISRWSWAHGNESGFYRISTRMINTFKKAPTNRNFVGQCHLCNDFGRPNRVNLITLSPPIIHRKLALRNTCSISCLCQCQPGFSTIHYLCHIILSSKTIKTMRPISCGQEFPWHVGKLVGHKW